ncbi:uncharacterized protein LTR77_002162 [Saxophila tyrrhenica]|uniref:Uncharacterized protein n=1 Tax=Saxophila tyrrhenica TaxID=1690608 RepID=A0AAV9PJK1_9PEZI|nr:hypothetical protein LTR77_002162 [Saxophila tyrrhenica]
MARWLLTLFLLAPLAINAQQLSDVPDLETATQTTATSTETTDGTTRQTTGRTTQDAQSTLALTNDPQTTTDASSSDGALRTPTATLTEPAAHLTDAPTIAGAGIPTLVVPWTAGAPFMQKSTLPEGTFFIAVGATLAFFGACVLLWRLMVAWSVNRSVKRTAMLASMGGSSEKGGRTTSSYWGGSSGAGYNRMTSSGGPGGKGGYYKDAGYESNVSLDNLTSAGKPMKPHFRDSVVERNGSGGAVPPPNLFFSPTAQAASHRDSTHNVNNRNSAYMPSGYYASPSAQAAGGNSNIAIGGNLAPGSYGNTNRYSAASAPSPPASPGLPPQTRSSYRQSASNSRAQSRDGLRGQSRDGLRAQSRDGLGSNRNSTYLYAQPSSSSLMVGGQSVSDLTSTAPSRAPSAYLEELFDNHGSGPRERF